MAQKPCPRLATFTKIPVRSSGSQVPELTLINDEPTLPEVRKQDDAHSPQQTVRTLQVIFTAEKVFLKSLRDIARENCGHLPDFENFQRKLNHDNILHVARFFFLLNELDCSGPDEIEGLIKVHNERIDKLTSDGDFSLRSKGELKKAHFTKYKIVDCKDSIGWEKRPAFVRAEIASFLFEHMGRDRAEKTVDDMVKAGLLTETTYSPKDGADRKLVKADGRLEDAVRTYLSDIWIAIKKA